MDNKRLNAFLKSAELGSVSAAASELGYTPSAVSQLVTSLEDELGLRLLNRSTKGVSATSEGLGLIPLVEEYMKSEQMIYDYADNVRSLSSGSISVAAYPSTATTWLPDIVKRFKENYPDISITIVECVRADICEQLDSGTADLGVMTYVEPFPYEWMPLADVEMIAVLPDTHPMAGAASYPVRMAEQDDLILTSKGQDIEVLNILDKNNVHPDIRYTTYDTPATLAMVQRGLGISIVNKLSAIYWDDHLVKMPLDPPEKITFGIAFRSYRQLTSAAKEFLAYAVRLLTREES